MAIPRLPFVCRPYFLLELPGWGVLYNKLGIHGIDNVDPRWADDPTRVCRGKHHGYTMRLRLNDDIDRDTYFLGRYYDLEIQLLLDELLSPGDTFLDIGANVGRTTLHAASRVGPGGRVIAVEPQPGCCERINEAIADNHLSHIEIHNVAAGEEQETLELKILGGGTILATLAIDEKADGPKLRDTIEVPVIPLDTIMPSEVQGKLVVKSDVEGFELRALRGLAESLARYRPPVITEVVPRTLERAGTSADQLFAFFHERDYSAYIVGLGRDRLRRSRVALTPISDPSPIDYEADILWAPNTGWFDPKPFT